MMRADYNGIANHEEVCSIPDPSNPGERILNPVTEALTYLAFTIGMRMITEENAEEFFTRVHVYETMRGALVSTDKAPRPITPDDVLKHVGLRVNGVDDSKTKFNNRIIRLVRDDATEMWTKHVC